MRQEVKDYIEEGNAIEVANGIYATQDSMYRNRLTEKDLEQYMIDEYGTVFTPINTQNENSLIVLALETLLEQLNDGDGESYKIEAVEKLINKRKI